MNWTSTKVPLWQIDCDEYRKLRRPFQLRDVGLEHQSFIQTYSEKFGLNIEREGTVVTFSLKRE